MSNKYTLSKDTATDMLNNILDNCDLPPSSAALEADINKRNLQRKKMILCKWISIVFLVIAVITPLAFNKDPQFQLITTSKTVVVSSHALYEDCFVMTLSGSANYNGIYAKKNDGALIFPDKIDSSTGLVIFPYNGDSLNIYIPTNSGECVQAILNETK